MNIGVKATLPYGQDPSQNTLLSQKLQMSSIANDQGRDKSSSFKDYEQLPQEYANKSFKSRIAPKNKESEVAKQKVQKLIKVDNTWGDSSRFWSKDRNSSIGDGKASSATKKHKSVNS